MKCAIEILIIVTFLGVNSYSQSQKVFTSDIDNFWVAYDSIRNTNDSVQQLNYIKTLYIKKGTDGLKAFMMARNYTAELWVKLIRLYPKFWNSIRPNTLAVKAKAGQMEESIIKFRQLYPELREARMYFTIGGLRSGGTTMGNMVLVGAEIATGDPSTDVSEFPDNWLASVFKEQQTDNVIPLNIHEYVHTQQKQGEGELLVLATREGACDFITELVIGHPMQNNYIKYGLAHEAELKEKFKAEMFSNYFSNWLYNGSEAENVADLGYFMGYTICKSYYNHAADKKLAIKKIIELDFKNSEAVETFLRDSKYYNEPIDKAALLKAFELKRPRVIKIEPFANGDSGVDPSLTEIKLSFNAAMNPNEYSIKVGEKGKDHYPIKGVLGFSDDNKTLALKIQLQPNHEYEFVMTDRGFKSTEGYPLSPYTVKFKTK